MKSMKFLMSLLVIATSLNAFAGVPAKMPIEGRLTEPDGTPLLDPAAQIRIQIRSPGTENCLLYSELFTVNLSTSSGRFAVALNAGSGTVETAYGWTFTDAFRNTGTFTTGAGTCSVGTAYTPTTADARNVQIHVYDGAIWDAFPAYALNSTAFSLQAGNSDTVGNLAPADLIQTNVATGFELSQANMNGIFTTASYNELVALIAGSSSKYATVTGGNLVMAPTKSLQMGSFTAGDQTTLLLGLGLGDKGKMWFNSTTNKMMVWDGIAAGEVATGSSSGTVTSVGFTAPTELSVSGGPVTTAGTITTSWATQTMNKVFASPDAVTGAPTFRPLVANDVPIIPWSKITAAPTTLIGYGINDAVRNAGGTVSVQSGLNGSKGAPGTAGRVWIATDSTEIYRDDGTTWVKVGSGAPSGDFRSDGTIPMAGQITATNGVVGAPSVKFASDPNTGFYSPAGGVLGFTTVGVERMRMTTGGNVGIGTTAPAYKLDVNGDLNITGNYRVNGVLLTSGAGTVTSVSSANPYLTVVTGTTTPALTLNVGTTASTVAAGDDARIINALPAGATFGGDVSGNFGTISVDRIRGTGISVTAPAAGNFLRYNGVNWINTNLSGPDITSGLGYTPVMRTGDTMTGILTLSADPTINLNAATKQYVDAVTTSSDSNFVRKDGTSILTADWDIDGGSAGTRKITGLVDPTLLDGAATKNYADTKFMTRNLPTPPTVGQNGQSLRWNNGTNLWEFYNAGIGDFQANGAIPMTGALVNNTNSATPAVAVTQAGAGPAATLMGGNVGIGTTSPSAYLHISNNAVSSDTQIKVGNTAANNASASLVFANDYGAGQLSSYSSSYSPVPSYQARLVLSSASTAAGVGLHAAGGGDITMLTGAGPNERMRIISDGRVGIGTATPGARLDIMDTSTTTSAIIVPRAPGTFAGAAIDGMIRYNTVSTLFEFRQNGIWSNYTTVSDGRLKTNVVPVIDGLGIVNRLNPVFYDWDRSNPKATGFEDKHQLGFIAQEVEMVLPEVVNRGADSYRSLEYGKIVSVVVAAIKELSSKFIGMDREIASVKAASEARAKLLEAENQVLKARLDQQDRELQAIKQKLGL